MTSPPLTYAVPISICTHAIAHDRTEHLGQNRRSQYLNILASLSAQYCLQSFGITAELEDLDSPLVAFLEMSDLVIPNVGQLYCRVILPEETHLSIPEEFWSDRVGYLAVQLREDLREAEILGFTSNPQQTIPLEHLEDLEAFVNYISDIPAPSSLQKPSETVINLRTWLTGAVTQGWSELSDCFNPPEFNLALRGAQPVLNNRPRQPIDIGINIGGYSLVLVITVLDQEGEVLKIQTQLQAMGDNGLPQMVQLEIQDPETNSAIASVNASEGEQLIELQLQAKPGDRLRTVIRYDQEILIQDFLV